MKNRTTRLVVTLSLAALLATAACADLEEITSALPVEAAPPTEGVPSLGMVEPAPEPILEYLFEEGAETRTANSGTYKGAGGTLRDRHTEANGPLFTKDVPPIEDSNFALSFDGVDDRVEVPNDFDYTETGAFIHDGGTRLRELTVEAWVKPSADILTAAAQFVLWDDYGNPGVLLAISHGHAQFGISTEQHPGLGTGLFAQIEELDPDEWHHLAGIYDGVQLRIFVDGQDACKFVTTSGGIINNSEINGSFSSAIGADNASIPALNYQGLIDDLRFYSVAVKRDQLAKGHFANTEQTSCAVPDAGGPYAASEGEPIAFTGAVVSNPDKLELEFIWDFGDGTTATGLEGTHSYADDGEYTVTLTVVDSKGLRNITTTTATVANAIPEVTLDPEASVVTSGTLRLEGSFSDPGSSDGPWKLVLDWGDGSPDESTELDEPGPISASHRYEEPGEYVVTATVVENSGEGGRSTLAVVVESDAAPPTANASGPYSGTEGEPILFDGTASSDPNDDELAFAWDFGDGATVTSTATPSHTYADDGEYTVTLNVSDPGGLEGEATTGVTVSNVVPVVKVEPTASVLALETFNLAASFGDPGSDDGPWAYRVDWGDGSPEDGGQMEQPGDIPGTHVYREPGEYVVTVLVAEREGESGTSTVTVTVEPNPLPPVADAGGPYSGSEGEPIMFDATATTDPNGDAMEFTWDFGDGTIGSGLTPSHTYSDNGEFTVTLVARDTDGLESQASSTASILNVAPSIEVGSDATVTSGEIFVLEASFADAGVGDKWSFEVDWGDGSPVQFGEIAEPGSIPGSHQYLDLGEHVVTVTVTDDDGGFSTAIVSVSVIPVSVIIDIKPGSDENPINLGETGVTPVAVLTTPDFDAADIDIETVTFGNNDGSDTPVAVKNNGTLHAALEDVDNDGDIDLLLHFDTPTLVANGDLVENTTELFLNARTRDGSTVQGRDNVRAQ